MKRILMALNSEKLSKEAIDFSCYLANLAQSKLTGVFIKSPPASALDPVAASDHFDEEHLTIKNKLPNTALFCEACISRETAHVVHLNKEISSDQLIKQTRFADVLILDQHISSENKVHIAPTLLAKHILQEAQCPVIFAPLRFDRIDEIIFTYDGSEASIFAIKQFTYLFPEFREHKILVVQVAKDEEAVNFNDGFADWMNEHYRHSDYIVLKGSPISKLAEYILLHENAFVVMGAYGRNFITSKVKPAITKQIAATIFNPIFIARN